MPIFSYKVDDEQYTTEQHELTPTQIMQNAGIDPATHYLVEMQGNHRISFQDKANEMIHMHNQMVFISISTGPTPVS